MICPKGGKVSLKGGGGERHFRTVWSRWWSSMPATASHRVGLLPELLLHQVFVVSRVASFLLVKQICLLFHLVFNR